MARGGIKVVVEQDGGNLDEHEIVSRIVAELHRQAGTSTRGSPRNKLRKPSKVLYTIEGKVIPTYNEESNTDSGLESCSYSESPIMAVTPLERSASTTKSQLGKLTPRYASDESIKKYDAQKSQVNKYMEENQPSKPSIVAEYHKPVYAGELEKQTMSRHRTPPYPENPKRIAVSGGMFGLTRVGSGGTATTVSSHSNSTPSPCHESTMSPKQTIIDKSLSTIFSCNSGITTWFSNDAEDTIRAFVVSGLTLDGLSSKESIPRDLQVITGGDDDTNVVNNELQNVHAAATHKEHTALQVSSRSDRYHVLEMEPSGSVDSDGRMAMHVDDLEAKYCNERSKPELLFVETAIESFDSDVSTFFEDENSIPTPLVVPIGDCLRPFETLVQAAERQWLCEDAFNFLEELHDSNDDLASELTGYRLDTNVRGGCFVPGHTLGYNFFSL
jgi:hypothetical protein